VRGDIVPSVFPFISWSHIPFISKHDTISSRQTYDGSKASQSSDTSPFDARERPDAAAAASDGRPTCGSLVRPVGSVVCGIPPTPRRLLPHPCQSLGVVTGYYTARTLFYGVPCARAHWQLLHLQVPTPSTRHSFHGHTFHSSHGQSLLR